MTPIRKLIVAFWIFIVCMLLWQFYSYDRGVREAAARTPQEHFFFYPTKTVAPSAPVQAPRDGADVEQTGFSVQAKTPNAESFSCVVTLKNVGNAKATGVQVSVRPYRGISLGDEDAGHTTPGILSDSDPVSQIGQWVTFSDLAPGESSTQTVVFLSRGDFMPGTNPKPDIIFQSEKAK
jgi:hypothetical protein